MVIANETDILNVVKKWKLPKNYLLFLKNFSPLNVYFQGLNLYGASELIKRQEGYSFNPITNQTIDEWPKNFVVIADSGSDPYCIDVNNVNENDVPVYLSVHGTGEWKFELYSESFLKFLKEITRN
ncbi:SMI1/KNR4 family protein [Tenacibaculum sp. nBUS_03]|uniref:SMI1/KNR4 family protein n=1 Tax=Tenacibaculum sp. nBUS_03 TaxID=3395320 RepID=UPI003EBCE571